MKNWPGFFLVVCLLLVWDVFGFLTNRCYSSILCCPLFMQTKEDGLPCSVNATTQTQSPQKKKIDINISMSQEETGKGMSCQRHYESAMQPAAVRVCHSRPRVCRERIKKKLTRPTPTKLPTQKKTHTKMMSSSPGWWVSVTLVVSVFRFLLRFSWKIPFFWVRLVPWRDGEPSFSGIFPDCWCIQKSNTTTKHLISIPIKFLFLVNNLAVKSRFVLLQW